MLILTCQLSRHWFRTVHKSVQGRLQVVYTYLSAALAHAAGSAVGVKCDLTDEAHVASVFKEHGPFDAVVNTAALSQPGVCEQDPERCRCDLLGCSWASRLASHPQQ